MSSPTPSPDSSSVSFIPGASVPYDITAMQTHQNQHQQSDFYPATPVNWTPRPSQNIPYTANRDINNRNWISASNPSLPPLSASNQSLPSHSIRGDMFNYMEYAGFSYDPSNTSGFRSSVGTGGMQLNYVQQQAAGESTSVATERYPVLSDFSGLASEEFQQFSSTSSLPTGFQLQYPTSEMTEMERNNNQQFLQVSSELLVLHFFHLN